MEIHDRMLFFRGSLRPCGANLQGQLGFGASSWAEHVPIRAEALRSSNKDEYGTRVSCTRAGGDAEPGR